MSDTDAVGAKSEWLEGGVIGIASDEVLEEQLGVSEVACVIFE